MELRAFPGGMRDRAAADGEDVGSCGGRWRGGLNGGGGGRWRFGIEWIRGASLAASPRLTASNVRAFDVDDRGDGEDDEAGGVESRGARSASSQDHIQLSQQSHPHRY